MTKAVRALRNANHLALTAWFIGFFALANLAPNGFALAFQEDGWGEWATFLAFALAAVLFGVGAFRIDSRGDEAGGRFGQAIALVLGLGCFFVAGEEISWGQRLFGLVPAELFLEHNYQQEINVHNLIEAVGIRSDWLIAALAVGYGILLPAYGAWFGNERRWTRALPDLEYAGWYAAVALGVAFVPFDLSVEAIEMLLGFLFAIDASERVLKHGEGRALARPGVVVVGLFAAVVGGGLLLPPTLDRVVYRATPNELEMVEAELSALATDLASPQSLNGVYFKMLNTIHKRIYTARRENYARLPSDGAFYTIATEGSAAESNERRTRRREYLIDPWGSAYWLAYNKERKGMVVYSLGPNRRRDTHLGSFARDALEASTMDGDDIGVWLDFGDRLDGLGSGG